MPEETGWEDMNDFLESFMKKLDFPRDAQAGLLEAHACLERDPDAVRAVEAVTRQMLADTEHRRTKEMLGELTGLARQTQIQPYTMHLLFFMRSAQPLLAEYHEKGIPEEVFWNSMADLRYKLLECRAVHGIWGTFVGYWFPQYYTMERFGLGRLQYQIAPFTLGDYRHGGDLIRSGDRSYQVHIPSAGPLTREKRMESYRRAYAFFRHELGSGPMVLTCESWLLYPENEKFLPEGSNIVDFMHDFHIVRSEPSDTFSDAWRVFGKDSVLPVDRLPVKTSLQRAYVKWLGDGNKTGYGYGVLLFDGERIL